MLYCDYTIFLHIIQYDIVIFKEVFHKVEKNTILNSLKDRLTQMNFPQKSIDKHLKTFGISLNDKTDEEIDYIIKSSGGLDGIVNSIVSFENAKKSVSTLQADDEAMKNAAEESTGNTDNVFEKTDESENKSDTKEINAVTDIDKHIEEAEKISNTLEHTMINQPIVNTTDNMEFADDISDYDFEQLFAEKISKPEQFVIDLRKKMSDGVFKYTLPLSILAFAIIFVIAGVLFPLLFASAIFVGALYVATLAAGICFALVPIGFGIYMTFHTMPIALYEIGIGITVLGTTMLLSILLYNYVKRLVPFLFKQIKVLFKLCIKLAKRYFKNQIKEEE